MTRVRPARRQRVVRKDDDLLAAVARQIVLEALEEGVDVAAVARRLTQQPLGVDEHEMERGVDVHRRRPRTCVRRKEPHVARVAQPTDPVLLQSDRAPTEGVGSAV